MDYTVSKIASKMKCFGGVYAENDYMATTTDLVFVGFGETAEEAVENMNKKIENHKS
jgi:predicted RNase H-like HicB family nuclease